MPGASLSRGKLPLAACLWLRHMGTMQHGVHLFGASCYPSALHSPPPQLSCFQHLQRPFMSCHPWLVTLQSSECKKCGAPQKKSIYFKRAVGTLPAPMEAIKTTGSPAPHARLLCARKKGEPLPLLCPAPEAAAAGRPANGAASRPPGPGGWSLQGAHPRPAPRRHFPTCQPGQCFYFPPGSLLLCRAAVLILASSCPSSPHLPPAATPARMRLHRQTNQASPALEWQSLAQRSMHHNYGRVAAARGGGVTEGRIAPSSRQPGSICLAQSSINMGCRRLTR